QAEDGIRDPLVTGVQTCALPISVISRCTRERTNHVLPTARRPTPRRAAQHQVESRAAEGRHGPYPDQRRRPAAVLETRLLSLGRSEERRVGKSVGVGGSRAIMNK